MKGLIAAAALAATVFAGAQAAHAQEAVVGVVHAESMFTSPDPKLNRNKQAAYHIMKDLLEAGHWDEAGKWLTKEYHQHNPLAASGLDGVVYYFTQVAKVKPKPVPEKLGTPIVAVLAEGEHNEVIGKMRVSELLQSMPGLGKVRAAQVMDRLKISESRRVRGLGAKQVAALVAEFDTGE